MKQYIVKVVGSDFEKNLIIKTINANIALRHAEYQCLRRFGLYGKAVEARVIR